VRGYSPRVPSFRFVTVWRLQAPIERVFATIDDTAAWPEWWPSVTSVERLAEGDETKLGAVDRMTFVGRLPYRLAFDMQVARRRPPIELVGLATGELEGVGDWSLRPEGDWTVVRYEWSIRTTRRWMNLLAPLPFVSEIFGLNHHAVMRDGLRGIRRRLGDVAGTYRRQD
jgi:hypothetical protein